jgi:Zn-dependent protease
MSWTIGKAFGIPVRLHFTMVLLPLLAFNWIPVEGIAGVITWLALVVMLFGSVWLHELGHALTARRYGIQTQDIVLTPIGGMARVIGMPRKPKQEIAIAVAGPLVSIILAGLAQIALILASLVPGLPQVVFEGIALLHYINLMLGLFNLIPALPMDGGRVLRGFLALKRDHLTATQIAARVGRVLAITGGILALFWFNSWSLALISVFVYMAAGQEVRMSAFRAYQERMSGMSGQDENAPFGNVRTWHWTWPQSEMPRQQGDDSWGANQASGNRQTANWQEISPDANRGVIRVKGGKAEVLRRGERNDKE